MPANENKKTSIAIDLERDKDFKPFKSLISVNSPSASLKFRMTEKTPNVVMI